MEETGEVIISWKLGLHIRPATQIAKLLKQFDCNVVLFKDEVSCKASSVMQLITLGAEYGDKILVSATGNDAKQAVQALTNFFNQYDDNKNNASILW